MKLFVRVFVVLLAVASAATPARAQKGAAPQVFVAQSGAERLLRDLEFVLMLTNEENREQWPVLRDYLEVFLIDVSRDEPVRIDMIFNEPEVKVIPGTEPPPPIRYRPAFPVPNLTQFRHNNLHKVGVITHPRSRTFFICRKAFIGFMRYLRDAKYVVFGETREDVPPKLPDPRAAMKGPLKTYLAAVLGRNEEVGADAIKNRREWFTRRQEEMLAELTRLENETEEDFELRKLLSEHQLDELVRLYAEGKELLVGGNLDHDKKLGKLDIRVSAIPGTSLAETIKMAGQKPSRFAGVPKSKDPILSLRLNHGFDEMRRANYLETLALLKKQAEGRIDDDKMRSDEEKKHSQELIARLHDLFAENIKDGTADGFLEVHANESGVNTTVLGVKTLDGTKAIDILKLLPKASKNQKVELNVDKEGDVQIHKAQLDITEFVHLGQFFAAEEVYVGTAKDSLWAASGENALAELKAAVKPAGQKVDKRPEDPFLDLFIKLGPWMELREKGAGEKGRPKLRRHAIEAFGHGDDALTLTLRREDDKITGGLLVRDGVLRFIGNALADFSRENLQ